MNRTLVFLAGIVLFLIPALSSTVAVAQDATARTVQYHSQDIVPIRAKLKYTTLIQVPATEKIMEAATGDKDRQPHHLSDPCASGIVHLAERPRRVTHLRCACPSPFRQSSARTR